MNVTEARHPPHVTAALLEPDRAVGALEKHRASTKEAGRYEEQGLVFTSDTGTVVYASAGLPAGEWTPHELRHSFVSLMSEAGVPLEDIAHSVGHGGTKAVCRGRTLALVG
jgi:integrase